MRIDIRTRGVERTPELLDHVRRRLEFALSRFGGRIRSVTVRIEDQNGPRGGADERCRLEVCGTRGWRAAAEATDAEAARAVDLAAERIGRTVAREMVRQREFAAR